MKKRIRIDKTEPNKGILNCSHLLDAPAGKHGFVKVKEGHLYFEDGTRARFIGFNMPTRSCTPDHEGAERQAERFASMGVNVVRLHAFDGLPGEKGWSACMESPVLDYGTGNSRTFHREGLERFDYFVARLKEKGIYLHIDLLVARAFQDGDGLDYEGAPGFPFKCFSHINRRLQELQKEYAAGLLTHINPYTGLALIDDPAVMAIQINNEDSALKGTWEIKDAPGIRPYRDELRRKFNHFLLMKYDTRKNLADAWTFEGLCGLEDWEDPEQGTVEIAEGSFVQPACDPLGEWKPAGEGSSMMGGPAPVCPARYADYMEFAMGQNHRYYQEMIDYVRSLGAKVPVAASNLLGGAADAASHGDGDLGENNTYFNHPLLPVKDNVFMGSIREYVSLNPMRLHEDGVHMRTTLLTMACVSAQSGKPFVVSEWNEYGMYPFHSTAFVQMAAYACLNDWDGLIIYCFDTSEKWQESPTDEILDLFNAYNDPSLICLFGFMAGVFLKGLVRPAEHMVDVVYTRNDLCTQPPCAAMPYTYLPYVTGTRNVFLENGDVYSGKADAAVNAGFVNAGDLSQAAHSVYYAWSPYRDAWRHVLDDKRLVWAGAEAAQAAEGVRCSDKALVFEDIRDLAGSGDYRGFAAHLDRALKDWGILLKDTGLVGQALVSDTGEICFDPENAYFEIRTPYCCFFSGSLHNSDPQYTVRLTDDILLRSENERISIALLGEGERPLVQAETYLLTALGATGMDGTIYGHEGFFDTVELKGKLYADTLEGLLSVAGREAKLTALDTAGNVIEEIPGEKEGEETIFRFTGEIPAVHFLLQILWPEGRSAE